MSKELRFKQKKNITNELSAFVNTIYDYFFHELKNLEDSLENENEPLHYLLTKIRIEATQKALHVYESIVNEATEYKEIEVEGNEKI
jgi:hypothetical protein